MCTSTLHVCLFGNVLSLRILFRSFDTSATEGFQISCYLTNIGLDKYV